MAKQCKICTSPNRAEYEDLRINKRLIYRDISQIAMNKHGEKFVYSTLSRHFTKDVDPYLESRFKSSKLKEDFNRKKIQEHIDASVNIVDTINVLKQQLDSIKYDMEDPAARKEARSIAKILSDVMRVALQYKEELKPEQSETVKNVYDRLLWSLEQAEIPIEYIVKIKDKWDHYESV